MQTNMKPTSRELARSHQLAIARMADRDAESALKPAFRQSLGAIAFAGLAYAAIWIVAPDTIEFFDVAGLAFAAMSGAFIAGLVRTCKTVHRLRGKSIAAYRRAAYLGI